MNRIACILPKGEGFSPQQFGAIALCVHDFTLASRFKDDTAIIGGMADQGFDGIRYFSPPPARWFEKRTRAYARGCAAILRKEKTKLAEIHNRPALLRLTAQQHISCRFALHLHNDPQDMDEAQTPGKRMKLLARCAAVYCASRYIRNRFLEGLPAIAGVKLRVIPNGIALPSSLPQKEPTILFVGRMTEGKGALLLAQALRMCLLQLPGWRAVFIGSRRHESGQKPTPHEQEIAHMLAPLGAQVQMTGFLSHAQVLEYFARAGVAVVPSVWQEPFGRTALEAMAYGCALISSGRGALAEVTQDAALTPQALTAQALATAITDLAHNDSERARLQAAARVRAQAFAIDACARILDEARESILARGLHES